MKNAVMILAAVLLWTVIFPPAWQWVASRSMPIGNVYELRQVLIEDFTLDSTSENSPRMAVDREILGDFRGFFRIDTRRIDGSRLEPVAKCSVGHSEVRQYRRGATLPDPLTLNWWIDGKVDPPCTRTPGIYTVSTQVCRILPGAESCTPWVTSNPFRISAPE